MPHLQVILASTRPHANSRPVGEWFADFAYRHGGLEPAVLDLAELALPTLDEPQMASTGIYVHEHTKRWSALVDRADAIVWVMPMYNGGFGAPQKNAIDYLYREWQHKPVGLVSYSGGDSGGRPAAEMLTPVLLRIGMRPSVSRVAIARIDTHVDAQRQFHATTEHVRDAKLLLDELTELARAPRPDRA